MWAVWEPWSALLDSVFHPKSNFAHGVESCISLTGDEARSSCMSC